MDALIIAGFVLAVLALVLAFVLAGIVAYIQYKYVALPWKVMRADVTALHAEFQALKSTVQQAQVIARSDAEVAAIEARINARQRAREAAGR